MTAGMAAVGATWRPLAEIDAEDAIFDAEAQDKAFVPLVDRYYARHYAMDVNRRPNEDMCILEHHNGLILLTLAPSHPARAPGRVISKADFDVRGRQLSDHRAHGKSKKGAFTIQENSILCELTMEDGTRYALRPCIRGNLLETNSRITKDPSLITRRGDADGYIAIFKVKPRALDHLTSRADYEAARGIAPAGTAAALSAAIPAAPPADASSPAPEPDGGV